MGDRIHHAFHNRAFRIGYVIHPPGIGFLEAVRRMVLDEGDREVDGIQEIAGECVAGQHNGAALGERRPERGADQRADAGKELGEFVWIKWCLCEALVIRGSVAEQHQVPDFLGSSDIGPSEVADKDGNHSFIAYFFVDGKHRALRHIDFQKKAGRIRAGNRDAFQLVGKRRLDPLFDQAVDHEGGLVHRFLVQGHDRVGFVLDPYQHAPAFRVSEGDQGFQPAVSTIFAIPFKDDVLVFGVGVFGRQIGSELFDSHSLALLA